EDGIRARNVTGVQTCALPILESQTLRYHGDMSKVWLPVALGLLLAVTAPAAAQLPQPRPNSPGTPDAFNTKNPPSQANSPAFVEIGRASCRETVQKSGVAAVR